MNRLQKHQIAFAGIFTLAVIFFASNSFAALNAYLQLKGQKTGKTYKTSVDAGGKFTFTDVEPDVYELSFEVRATDAAGNTGSDSKVSSIEISSFSWGTTNSGSISTESGALGKQGKSTPVTRSNISNNRTFTVDAQGPVVTISGMTVATGDVDGDGFPDKITSPVSVTPTGNTGVILKNIVVTTVSSPSGKLIATYDLKKGVK